MSRSGKDRDTRVRTAKKRTASSTRWLQRQLNDPYVKQAKAEGYRSRAAYKLIELDEKFGLLKGITRVVDLGIAPGGWSQVVRKLKPKAHVVGIDLLEVEPIDGVTIFQMDFMDDDAPRVLEEAHEDDGGGPVLAAGEQRLRERDDLALGEPPHDRLAHALERAHSIGAQEQPPGRFLVLAEGKAHRPFDVVGDVQDAVGVDLVPLFLQEKLLVWHAQFVYLVKLLDACRHECALPLL